MIRTLRVWNRLREAGLYRKRQEAGAIEQEGCVETDEE